MKTIIGVMGGGFVGDAEMEEAEKLGALIAREGWVLLNGGRNAGIMTASAKGARSEGGITIGILPDEYTDAMSPYIDIPVVTGMGSGRNIINILSSHVVVACRGGAGTISEIALAMKYGKPIILMNFNPGGFIGDAIDAGRIHVTGTPDETIEIIKTLLKKKDK